MVHLIGRTKQHQRCQSTVAERVNGVLKQTFLLNTKNIDSKTMKTLVKQSVETYNQYQPHLPCKTLTTTQMLKQKTAKIKTYKNKNLREFQLSEI